MAACLGIKIKPTNNLILNLGKKEEALFLPLNPMHKLSNSVGWQ